MGCDLVKMRDELLGELYSSGATPKAIDIAKLQIESEIYNIRMTSKKVKNTEEFNIEEDNNFYDSYETEYNYSMSDITNHSGGANGADILWDKTGSKYGMTKNNHYYMGEKSKTNAPHGNVEISKDEISEGQVEAAKAASRNYGYSLPKMKDERITRNWVQVKNSNQIVAISLIADSGEKLMPDQASDTRTANLPSVTGGTGYAVSMGINHKKEIYVYNQKDNASGKYPQGWYKYDYNINDFVKSEIPVLSKDFAGIGSRNLSDSGKKAIEDVYKNTSEKLLTEIREKYNENKSSEPVVVNNTIDLKVKDNTGKDSLVKIVNNFIDNATQDKIKNTIQGIFESYKNTDEIKSNKNDKTKHKSIVFGPIDYSYTSGKKTITHKAKPIVNEDINKLIAKAEKSDGVPAGYYNQVLINEYASGIGMGMHTDAEPIYKHNNDAIGKVAIISIGNIKSTNKSAFGSENNNVDVTSGSLATMSTGSIKHSVGQADTGGRISITLRHIPEANVKTTQAIKLAESENEVFPIIESTSVEPEVVITPGSENRTSTEILKSLSPKAIDELFGSKASTKDETLKGGIIKNTKQTRDGYNVSDIDEDQSAVIVQESLGESYDSMAGFVFTEDLGVTKAEVSEYLNIKESFNNGKKLQGSTKTKFANLTNKIDESALGSRIEMYNDMYGEISGSGPKEWRVNEDSDMLMMDMGFDNITTFIDKLVGLTGDMSKRSNNASYHTQLKSIIDNIKNMMNEYKFDKQIRVVLLNTEDTFTNATFESYPEVTMIEDKDGIPRLYSGMLTLRYGKDYDSKKRQNIRTDENGNQTSEVLDSYENAMSGFRELVLHEMLHAMIDEAMRYDNDLYAKTKAIQKRFAGKVTAESMTEAMKDISGFEATADHYTQMNDIVKYINGSPVEFLTYALTNPMVYEILDKTSGSANMELITTIKRDPTVKKSIFATIIDILIKTINNVYSITKIGKGKPLDTLNNIVLNAMAKGIVTAGLNDAEKQREIQDSKYESYNLGEGILNISANYRKYEDKIKEFNAKTFDRAMAKDGRIKLGSRIEAAARWMNKFEFIRDNKEKGRFRLFSDIANTVLEDTTSKDGGAADFYKLFREIKGNRDRDKVGMTQVARNYLDELWKDQDQETRNSMTYMLQADWKGLGLSLEEYGKIVANDEMITKEIEALKSKIKAVEYINGAKDLGYYIVHGVSKSPELMRNAKMIYNRAYDIRRKPLVQYSEPEVVSDIDKLASLYALRFMDKSTRVNLAKVINSDIELVEATSNMYYTYYEGQAKKFIATGLDKYLEKGGMRKNTQVPKNFEVLPEDKIRKSRLFAHTKIRIDEATTEAMNDGKTYWLVVSDDYGVSRTQGGFDDIHIIDKGMGLRNIREDAMDLSSMHEMIDARSRKAPYYLNKTLGDTLAEMNQLPSQLVPAFDIYGNVIDYEIPISEYDRKQVGMMNDIAETLSRTISHIHSKENAVGNNVKFAQMLIKDSTENAGKPGYVLLRPSTIDEIASGTRHRYDEEWAMIPNYIQRMIISRDENGLAVRDGLWVKEGRMNNIIGYKDSSIVNMKLFGKDKPMLENHPEVKRALEVLEYYWKQIAGRYKEIVVKLFPNVVYGNFTSNMWVAMRHGIGPMEYAKAFKRHWSGLTDYLEMSEELTKLKLMQDAGKTGLDSKIKELEDRMSLNSFDKLIKDGQFSTILEDLDLTGLTSKSHLADMIDEKVAKGGKIAKKAKSIVDELYINRNTQSHKAIEKLTVFNDIINRSIITERLIQDLDSISFADKAMKDEKIQDILNYVDMLFVNYSYLDNKYVKYVNDTNIVLFTKYFFRALKANLAMMTRNPLSSLGFEGIDTFVTDISDSFDQYGSPIDTIARKIFPNPIDMLGDLLVPNIANPIIEGR